MYGKAISSSESCTEFMVCKLDKEISSMANQSHLFNSGYESAFFDHEIYIYLDIGFVSYEISFCYCYSLFNNKHLKKITMKVYV